MRAQFRRRLVHELIPARCRKHSIDRTYAVVEPLTRGDRQPAIFALGVQAERLAFNVDENLAPAPDSSHLERMLVAPVPSRSGTTRDHTDRSAVVRVRDGMVQLHEGSKLSCLKGKPRGRSRARQPKSYSK